VASERTGRSDRWYGSHWLPFVIAGAVVLLDRVTKAYIRLHFRDWDSVAVIPGWFRIVHTENPGAAFGFLAQGNAVVRTVLLIGVSLVVLFFVVSALISRKSSFTSTATRIGLGFILGGAVGNLYDRILTGTVTDFIEVYNGSWSFPAFNIADSAITVGAVFLLIDLLRPQQRRASHPAIANPAEPTPK
jgi:signal peptidase II